MSEDSFLSLFGAPASTAARAPGRVNLIGEHTDYNDGFVLPMVIPQETRVEVRARDDQTVRGYSVELRETRTYRIGAEEKQNTWIDYVQGLTQALAQDGHVLRGFDLRVESNVPVGSGLSSSAALEVSVLRALREVFRLKLDDLTIARLGQRAENDFVGAPVGIMDQMASSLGLPNTGLFIDTRSLEHRRVSLPPGQELCVISSGISHAHGTGDYKIRRRECEAAARLLGVQTLREVGSPRLKEVEALPPPANKRARHVITENDRVLAAVRAMESHDLHLLGRLFHESHASMRDDFEVSLPEIDLLVELAEEQPDVFGARLTGGGFGGSIVILAKFGSAKEVAKIVSSAYDARTGQKSRVLVPDHAGREL